MTIAVNGLIFALLPLFLYNAGLAAAFRVDHVSVYAGLVFFGFLFTPVSIFLGIFASVVSRRFEYQADAYAVETTGQPEPMIAALKKLNVDNYGHLTPHPLVVFLRYSRPPVLERIPRHPAADATGSIKRSGVFILKRGNTKTSAT